MFLFGSSSMSAVWNISLDLLISWLEHVRIAFFCSCWEFISLMWFLNKNVVLLRLLFAFSINETAELRDGALQSHCALYLFAGGGGEMMVLGNRSHSDQSLDLQMAAEY